MDQKPPSNTSDQGDHSGTPKPTECTKTDAETGAPHLSSERTGPRLVVDNSGQTSDEPSLADLQRFKSCSECEGRMSRRAFACPRCGAPNMAKFGELLLTKGNFILDFLDSATKGPNPRAEGKPKGEAGKDDPSPQE